MYKLIIIEDESQMNQQLTKILDWESIGFEIVKTFENGADAIDYINKFPVDAVLTDIRIPTISGVELAKICHTFHPDIKFVFISAFRNFEYARSAIKYNVVDYITKPITYNEFYNGMMELYKEVDKIHQISSLQKRNEFIEDEIAFMRQEYLSSYILGVIDIETLIKHLSNIGINVDKDNSSCAQISIKINNFDHFIGSTWKHTREHLNSTINKFVTPENDYAYFSVSQFIHDTLEIVVIGKQQYPDDFFKKILSDYLEVLSSNMKSLMQIDITINILQVVKSLSDLKKYKISKNSALQLSSLVISYIHDGNPQEAVRTIQITKKIFGSDLAQGEKFCRLIFTELLQSSQRNEDMRMAFLSISDVGGLYDFLIDCITNPQKLEASNSDQVMKKAIDYIGDHYTENITLADVANHVALSSGYLSSIFKHNTGEKFIDYLSKLRIEKAKELLLNSNIKITSVANLVGYKDPQYFHRVFKLYSGTTPSKFRIDNGKE